MIPVAAYIRISSQQQKDDLQRAELADYCQRQGWQMVEYVEHESTRKARPVLERLMADIAARRVTTCIVWKLDRFGRSITELVSNIEALDRAGCRFICITQGIDTDKRNPASRLLLHILASVADFERDLRAERCASGTAIYREKLANGVPVQSHSGKNLPIGRRRILVDRQRVRDLLAAGATVKEMGAVLGVSPATAGRAARAIREQDSTRLQTQ